jgi:CRP-like cAMP-binding protein
MRPCWRGRAICLIVTFPHSGIISLVLSLANGEKIEVAMIAHDSVFGASVALDGQIALDDAIVQLPGEASTLDAAHLRAAAAQSESFRTTLIRHAEFVFVQAQQSAAYNASHALEARPARWLLRARNLSGSDSLYLTQEFLGQMLGVQRSSVSLVASALNTAGLIHYRRGRIEITNLGGLRNASCECHTAVKAQYDRLIRK